MTNIQTLAYNTKKKPTKDNAQYILEKLYKESEDAIQKQELAALYKWFTPASPKVCNNKMQWVEKAKEKSSEPRYYLHNGYYDGENYVATDGHRLHLIPLEADFLHKNSYYDYKCNIIECEGNFPQYKKIIPKKEVEGIFNIDNITMIDDTRAEILLFNDTTYHFNIKYILDAMNGTKECKVFSSDKDNLRGILLVFEDKRQAVIQPMRQA